MNILYNPIFLEHDTGMHPENKKRLEAFTDLPVTNIRNGEEFLTLYHTKDYIEHVKQAAVKSEHLDPDTVTSPQSYEAACFAVGASIMASESNDFALVRPPGHHAHPDHSSGFCIFNNLAIAVQKLLNDGKRVLIFDFDAHLGDGTEKFFYGKKNVVYMSFHQDQAFPGGGGLNDIGEGDALGHIINVTMPGESGDDVFIHGVKAMMPIAEQFNPDVVAVSAGFDGHHEDLLLNLRYSLNAYYDLGKILGERFTRMFATLEGGYNTEFLPRCVHNFIDGVNGKPQQYEESATDSGILVLENFEGILQRLKEKLGPYWKF